MALVEVNWLFSLIGVWGRRGLARGVCGERMGCDNIGYRDAAVQSGRLKMAPVEVNWLFRLIGVWGRGGAARGVCDNIGYRDAAV